MTSARLASGQTCRQIASAMGLTLSAVRQHVKGIRREAKRGMEPQMASLLKLGPERDAEEPGAA